MCFWLEFRLHQVPRTMSPGTQLPSVFTWPRHSSATKEVWQSKPMPCSLGLGESEVREEDEERRMGKGRELGWQGRIRTHKWAGEVAGSLSTMALEERRSQQLGSHWWRWSETLSQQVFP